MSTGTTWPHPRPAGEPGEEAGEYAVDAEEQAAGRAREDRERASLEDFIARVEARLAARQAIEAAVAAAGWGLTWRQGSECGSVYFWLDDPESGARYSLRVSDHFAPEGAGWDGSLRCRHEPPDINIVIRRGEAGGYAFDLSGLAERLGG